MILVLGGTSESRDVAIELNKAKYRVIYVSTTDLIGGLPETVNRITKILTPETFESLVKSAGIKCVLDATHPFAVEISNLAINVALKFNIHYIRLERESIENLRQYSCVQCVKDIYSAVSEALKYNGVILSVLGIRKIPEICKLLGDHKKKLVVRILPTSSSINICEEMKIHPSKIIAMQGPFDLEFDLYCIRHYNAKVMIAKESGDRGGLQSKIEACGKSGCKLIILERPVVTYPIICKSINQCMAKLSEIIKIC